MAIGQAREKGGRIEMGNIHAGATDQLGAGTNGDAKVDEFFLISGVLKHHGGAAGAEHGSIDGLESPAHQARALAGAEEHVSEAGDGIDHPRNVRKLGGDGAVEAGLDREMMNQGRLLALNDAQQIHQSMGFQQRVDGATGHQPGMHGETLGLEQGGIAVVGSDGFHLIAGITEILEQGQAEIVEIPTGVGYQQDLRGRHRFSEQPSEGQKNVAVGEPVL